MPIAPIAYQRATQDLTRWATNFDAITPPLQIPTPRPIQPSGAATFALQTGFHEVQVTADLAQVQTVYRRDGSLALRATATFDLALKRQETILDLTLPYEAFAPGSLDLRLFANGPLQIQLDQRSRVTNFSSTTQSDTVKPLRSVEEILGDLTRLLGQALRQQDMRSLRIDFDEEALQVLGGLSSSQELMRSLSSLMLMIRTLASADKTNDYWLHITGQGQPYQISQRDSRLEIEEEVVQLRLTILPPASAKASPLDVAEGTLAEADAAE
jgi:hypothetical protein